MFGGRSSERLALNEDTLWSGMPRDWNNPGAKEHLPIVRKYVFEEQDYHAADAAGCRGLTIEGAAGQNVQARICEHCDHLKTRRVTRTSPRWAGEPSFPPANVTFGLKLAQSTLLAGSHFWERLPLYA